MDRVRFPLLPRSLRWLGVLGVAGVICYFSLVTVPPEPPSPTPFWDKRLHFAAYAGFALVLAYATANLREHPSRRVALVIGGALAFGAGIELLQGATPHRYFGWGDLLANALGAALGSLWFPVERRIRYVGARTLAAELAAR
ncbi:VanZ family protein [Halorarum halophilum]|uniref:VanZ family protein n=1 Tax=Halorarum halophilum TaxID=2743090 RepID=A0A7D5K923_9EURY|nr:VanZ family protein [Halobaculum halophilum]QLG28654.1 VanZ family protein [Halobaculum halophilum]